MGPDDQMPDDGSNLQNTQIAGQPGQLLQKAQRFDWASVDVALLQDRRQPRQHLVHDRLRHAFQLASATRADVEGAGLIATHDAHPLLIGKFLGLCLLASHRQASARIDRVPRYAEVATSHRECRQHGGGRASHQDETIPSPTDASCSR